MDNDQNIQTPQTTQSSGLQPNVAATLSYLVGFITGLFFYLTSKDRFVRFHAMQSIIVSVAVVAVNLVLGYIPYIGMITGLVSLGELILVIFLMVKAYQGVKFKVPVIGDYAEKYA